MDTTEGIKDHHMPTVQSQYQQFFEMLATKGVAKEEFMKFIQSSFVCISTWNLYISELLSSIVFVIDNTWTVFEVENAHEVLKAIIGQVLVLLVSIS